MTLTAPVRDESVTAGKRKSLTGSCVDCGARIWTSAIRCRVCCFRQRGPRWKGGYLRQDGYKLIQLAIGAAHEREHVVVAERALGRRMPPGAVVHHVNGIRTDNAPQNLVIFQSSNDHLELHRKMRVKAHGGDPWTDRMCCTCGPRHVSEFYFRTSKRTANGREWASECKSCALRRQRTLYAAKKAGVASPVYDTAGRPIAPPQPVYPVRPQGPWDQNRDARTDGAVEKAERS